MNSEESSLQNEALIAMEEIEELEPVLAPSSQVTFLDV